MLKKVQISHQTPKEIVVEMNKYIIGQEEAKKAVAIAFVNRGRRMMIDDENLRAEISPKNVLLSGPTGVGKTEIARRVADITDSPFLKVEMTKFTEVGYAGKDVESIIRDLVEITLKKEKDKLSKAVEMTAKKNALKYVFKALQENNKARDRQIPLELHTGDELVAHDNKNKKEIQDVRILLNLNENKLANGDYDNQDVTLEVPDGAKKDPMENLEESLTTGSTTAMISIIPLFSFGDKKSGGKTKKTMKVRDALEMMANYYIQQHLDKNLVVANILKKIEQKGVIFLDEIDKLISNKESHSRGEVSREGVQRDLLPLIEGTMVQTKYGIIRTDHILFIAAGAFHDNKVSDLMPELQGRFPIHVKLKALKVAEFEKILTDLKYNLPEQQQKLLKVDGIEVKFEKSGLQEIAKIAYRMNSELENTGVRRLFSVMEKVMEEVGFSGKQGTKVVVDKKYVEKMTEDGFADKIDTRKYMI